MANLPIKSKQLAVKLTPKQYTAIEKRAEKCGVRIGTWMRSILLQAANGSTKEGYMRIHEPNGEIS